MRLQQPVYVQKPVENIRLRITAIDVPKSAWVKIADVQLQPGEQPTGVVFNPAEVGTTPGRAQFRNGVVLPGQQLVALSNTDRATPTRVEVRNASGRTTLGAFHFGALDGSATVDGERHQATHGYGRAPIITERQDLNLSTDVTARLHVRIGWHERAQ